MVLLGPMLDPKSERSKHCSRCQGGPPSGRPHLYAHQASALLALRAVLPRVIPHPLGQGPPQTPAASVWETR